MALCVRRAVTYGTSCGSAVVDNTDGALLFPVSISKRWSTVEPRPLRRAYVPIKLVYEVWYTFLVTILLHIPQLFEPVCDLY